MTNLAQSSALIGSVLGFFAVMLGAFGAHALKARLSDEMLTIWKTANEYHFYHALALLLVGLLAREARAPGLNWSAGFFLAGVLVFSGSLYLLALTGTRWLGAITPIGGLLFLAGWVALAWSASRA
ncbi:MAG: DUF423 domain-containing protein [Panacagrimonas sp.]